MTFLLFLASIAVLEYLVGSTGRKSQNECAPSGTRATVEPVPLANETPTADLLALGRALGCVGKAADSEPVPNEIGVAGEGPPQGR